MHSFVTRFPRLLCYACASPRLCTRGTCGTLTCVDGAPCDYPICSFVAAPNNFVSVYFVQQETWNFFKLSNWRNENLHTECTTCKLALCFVLCSQTCACTLLYTFNILFSRCFGWAVGGWVFLPASLLALFLFTHPPTTEHQQHKYLHFFIYGHTPSPNWLGSRISPKLEWEKRWVSAIRNLQSCLWCTCFAVMFLFFVQTCFAICTCDLIWNSGTYEQCNVYLRSTACVWFCVGGLGK